MKVSLQQYEEIGAELSFLRSRLSTLSCEIGCKLEVSKPAYKHIRESLKQLDKQKSGAEEALFRDHPELG